MILLDRQLKKRLTHTAQHFACTGQDGYGDKTYAAPVDRACYREQKNKFIRNLAGEEVVSALQLYFDGVLTVGADDKFNIDGAAKSYLVRTVSLYDGLKPGTGATVVYL